MGDLVNHDLATRHPPEQATVCHRLDRETSGLIIFAKNAATEHDIIDQFRQRKVEKTYYAIIRGTLKQPQGTLRTTAKTKYEKTPKLMVSQYEVISIRKGYSVLKVKPITGRTNQIRIQFSKIGHPILGERVYAFRRDFQLKVKHLMLHSFQITFTHPQSKKRITLSTPPPALMRKMMEG